MEPEERVHLLLETRNASIGRFLGRQEGRGGYIAPEIETETTEGKKVVYIPVSHNS